MAAGKVQINGVTFETNDVHDVDSAIRLSDRLAAGTGIQRLTILVDDQTAQLVVNPDRVATVTAWPSPEHTVQVF